MKAETLERVYIYIHTYSLVNKYKKDSNKTY